MPFLELPKRLHPDFAVPNKQPRGEVTVDNSSWISKDLDLYWDLRSSAVRELVRGAVLKPDTADTGFGIDKGLSSVTFLEGNNAGVPTGVTEGLGDNFSITALCRFDGDVEDATEKSIFSSFVNTAGFVTASSDVVSDIVETDEWFVTTLTFDTLTNVASFYLNGDPVGAPTISVGTVTGGLFRYDPATNRLDAFLTSAVGNLGQGVIGASAHAGGDSWGGGIAFCSLHRKTLTAGEVGRFHRDFYDVLKPKTPPAYFFSAVAAVTGALTGTTVPTITEADIVSGGETSIITLTNDTWVASGATFNAQRQAIIDGFDAASSPTNGWNNEVQANEVVTAVVRDSDTQVTVTWTAAASYDISSTETITCTIPNAALVTSGSDIIATPTFTVTAVAAGRVMSSLAGAGGLAGFGGIAGKGGGLAG